MGVHAARGRSNAAVGRMWRERVRLAALREGDDGIKALDKIAVVLIESALKGDMAAIKEIGDRLDGKPAQVLAGDDDNPLKHLVRFGWMTTKS